MNQSKTINGGKAMKSYIPRKITAPGNPSEDGPLRGRDRNSRSTTKTPETSRLPTKVKVSANDEPVNTPERAKTKIRASQTETRALHETVGAKCLSPTNENEEAQEEYSELRKKSRAVLDNIRGITENIRHGKSPPVQPTAHVVRLLPAQEPLDASQARAEYHSFMDRVGTWFEAFFMRNILAAPEDTAPDAAAFTREMQAQADLLAATHWKGTDPDVLTALTLRILKQEVFDTVLYGEAGDYEESIHQMVKLMVLILDPSQEDLSTRSWTTEGYRAILSAAWFDQLRQRKSEAVTARLIDIFSLLYDADEQTVLKKEIEQNIVEPAMRLHEQLLTSGDEYSLDLELYTDSPDSFLGAMAKGGVECYDVLQGRLRVAPTLGIRMRKDCKLPRFVLVKAPALVRQRLGEAGPGPRETVSRQRLLVACDASTDGLEPVDEDEETVLSGWCRRVGVDVDVEHESF